MTIDSHQHFWDPVRGDYLWMKELVDPARQRLLRPVEPEELRPLLAAAGVEQTVLVQAAPTEAEGQFLLELAQDHEFIAGVVTWVDLEAPDLRRKLLALARHPKFVGVRPMVQDLPDPAWLLRPAVRRGFGVLEDLGVCFDFLVKPAQTEAMLTILEAHGGLRAVIDHVAKPRIFARELDPWRDQMRRAAAHPNCYCKLSGMVTEADASHWIPADLVPYVQHVVAAFGAERCMFGSDWPVCTLAGSYAQVLAALRSALAPLSLDAAAYERIFGGTAADFYRLPRAC